jgi:uridine kinase
VLAKDTTNGDSTRSVGPFLIGIAGGTASGKTTVASAVQRELETAWGKGTVASFSQDSFYKSLDHDQLKDVASYNFDHPDAFEWQEFLKVLKSLKPGGKVRVPKYDFSRHQRMPESESSIYDGSQLHVVIVEGILLFHCPEVRELFDLRIFVDVDSDTRLCRRVQRDVRDRGREIKHVLAQYQSTVKPSFDAFCQPTKQYADIIMPRGIENNRGLQVILDCAQRGMTSSSPQASDASD